MGAPLLAVLVASVLLAALARRYDVSAPLGLVVAGLAVGLIPGVPAIEMQPQLVMFVVLPQLVMFVVLPPLLWSAGLESSYLALRKNVRPIGLLAVGLPLATTLVVGFVAFHTVPELTVAAALTLGAIVAPPDAVSAAAIGRRLGLPRQIMTLLGGESLLNDATALTAYKVALAAAIGAAATWQGALGTFALAALGGVVIGGLIGWLIEFIRTWLDDPLVESAIGLVAPYFVYWLAEEAHGSGVIAVVVAALLLGQRATRASYATRLQDDAVWKSIQLVLESFAFLMIGLQLPTVIDELTGIRAVTLAVASAAVLATVIAVRIVWVYVMAYTPRMLFRGVRDREPAPTPSQVFIVAWAGMRGVVSLAAAFGVPLVTLSGDPFPGRPQLVFLTFVVVIGTLLLHGLTLPWLIRTLDVRSEAEAHQDALEQAAASSRAAQAAADRLDELLARSSDSSAQQHVGEVLQSWNDRRRNAVWERLGRSDDDIGESPASAMRRLRLEMLAAERETYIAERDAGNIDDEVLRSVLHGLDLEEAALNRE
ncbi:MAG: Na+/H+ antiporter [Mycobacterium sp.]|jgi:CPA1 family monovalent cation:H+ antiporter|nr:MAG: Na+/H+ antiporter [Mycobacterium sp.]